MTVTNSQANVDATVAQAADLLAMRRIENPHRDGMTETWLNTPVEETCMVLLRDHSRRFPTSKTEEDHWWLIADGTAVAYLHTMSHFERDAHQQVLCDIEVREGHRGHGYARRIVTAAQEMLGDVLHTTGGFTPLGAQALAWLPVLPGYDAGVQYRDMPFVKDWDHLIPLNPL